MGGRVLGVLGAGLVAGVLTVGGLGVSVFSPKHWTEVCQETQEVRRTTQLRTLTHSCWNNPAAWDGQLEDGRYFSVRWRYGILTVRVGATPDAAVNGECLVNKWRGIDSPLTMTTETMLKTTGLHWP